MNTSELAELFLTSLYDLAETKGHGNMFSLNDIAKQFGVTDQTKISNTAKSLESRNLIYPVGYSG